MLICGRGVTKRFWTDQKPVLHELEGMLQMHGEFAEHIGQVSGRGCITGGLVEVEDEEEVLLELDEDELLEDEELELDEEEDDEDELLEDELP